MLDYQRVRDINLPQLKREDLASQLRFTELNDSLSQIQKHLVFFQGKESQLTQNQQNSISGIGAAFLQWCDQIKNFNQGTSENLETAIARKNDLVNQVRQLETNVNSSVLSIINDIKLNSEEVQQNISVLNTKISTIDQTFQNKINEIDQKLQNKIGEYDRQFREKIKFAEETTQEADNLIKEARDFSTNKLVDKYGPIFEDQARKNWIAAMVSLGVFIIATLSTIELVVYLFKPLIDQLKDFDDGSHLGFVISNIIFRLTLLTLVFLFIKESLKNYNVNMHLYNLNKHRQNSLLSFNTFIGNTNDEPTRTFLIKEISKTIYSTGQIGYLTEDKKGLSTSQILDIVKTIKS